MTEESAFDQLKTLSRTLADLFSETNQEIGLPTWAIAVENAITSMYDIINSKEE